MSWLPKKLVIVPVDFSELTSTALAEALTMVDHPTDVHAIHVLPELPVTEPGVIWETVDDQYRIEHALEAMRERLAENGFGEVQMVVKIGDPGREITQYAETAGADLIVIPSHGRSGLAHFLMGSVTERVVQLSHCPVVVLKSDRQ